MNRCVADVTASPSSADLVEVNEQIRGILVDTDGARLAQLVGAVTAALQSCSERAAAGRGEQVPGAVAHDECRLDRTA